MKKLSKILSIALCLAMVLAMFTFGAGAVGESLTKVTAASSLTSGTKVIFVGTKTSDNTSYAMADQHTSNYRNQVAISNVNTLASGAVVFTVENGSDSGSVAFKGSDGKYLAYSSSAGNKVYTSTSVDSYSSWTVTVTNGVATITNVADTERMLQYNAANTRFACYKASSNQADPSIYIVGEAGSGSGSSTPAPTPKNYMILADGKAATGLTGTSSYYYPTAVEVEVNGTNVVGPNAQTIFAITEVEGGVTIKEPSGKYWTANDDTYTSVSVSDTPSVWTMTSNGLTITIGSTVKTLALDTTRGSFGAYTADKLTADHVTTLTFIENPTYSIRVEEKTIAEILAANSTGTSYKTTGKVNYISGKNVYIQDGTSAICAYFSSAPSGLSVGDVITVEGSYKVYKGLPELDQVASYTTASGKDYTVNETTIGALTNADICTAIKLSNLTIKAIGTTSNKPAYTLVDAQNNEIVWFNPVLGDLTLQEGDVIVSLECVVGCFNDLQLANDAATDVVVCYHTNFTWEADADSHWKLCSNTACGAIFDECVGTPTVEKNDTQHWTECICGYESAKLDHDFGTDYVVGTTGHYQQCACGQKTAEEDHDDGNNADDLCDKCGVDLACPHTSWKDGHDSEDHWSECEACGTKKDVAEHTLTTEKDQDGHWSECECGYASEKVGHTMTDKNDKDGHWSECECGYASEKVKHTLTFKNDDKQHWSVCDCGYVSDKVNHKLTNNKCECGFEKPAEVKGYSKLPITKPSDVKEGYYVLGGAAQSALDNGDTYTFLGNEPDAKDRINGVALNGKNNVVTPTGNAQVWQFIASGNGFKIKNVATGKYLYYKGSSNAIYLTDNEAEAGIWVVTAHDNGFGLQDSASGRFLGVNRFGKEGSYYLGFAAYNLSQYVTGAIDLYVADANAKPTPNTGDGISAVVALLAVSGMGLVVMTAKKKEN